MLTVRRRGITDLEPVLTCAVCARVLLLAQAWLGFVSPTDEHPSQAGRWLHRACSDGRARALFGADRVTLWRARDCLERLLRATEPPRGVKHDE
jgi:hypothetical protein